MPTLQIDELFIHDAEDHSNFIKLRWTESSGDDSGEQSAAVYAAGNSRIIESEGAIKTRAWSVRALTPSQVEEVRDFLKQFVMVRDSRGFLGWGSFASIPFDNWRNPRRQNITLELTSVTFDEEV